MKKYNSLAKSFTDSNKQISEAGFKLDPEEVYLAYCALALCTIADKMTDGSEEKDAETESGK